MGLEIDTLRVSGVPGISRKGTVVIEVMERVTNMTADKLRAENYILCSTLFILHRQRRSNLIRSCRIIHVLELEPLLR